MSRIGKLPITLPAGVTVSVDAENVVTVTSSKGTLTQKVSKLLNVKVENNQVIVEKTVETTEANAMHGLYRTLINNMVEGLTNGFKKSLTVNGVGYKVAKQGNKIIMNLGLSHPVEVVEENGVKLNVPSITEIVVEGVSKEAVGAMAAKIRAIKPVEPYHGYGIRYTDEKVSLKEGKSSGKGGKK
ncbi:MAG: 50S ribosomal protein L6 [Clostridia bacterium]|nr:50S ribosomal protein L6 [Clostridia bacterium]